MDNNCPHRFHLELSYIYQEIIAHITWVRGTCAWPMPGHYCGSASAGHKSDSERVRRVAVMDAETPHLPPSWWPLQKQQPQVPFHSPVDTPSSTFLDLALVWDQQDCCGLLSTYRGWKGPACSQTNICMQHLDMHKWEGGGANIMHPRKKQLQGHLYFCKSCAKPASQTSITAGNCTILLTMYRSTDLQNTMTINKLTLQTWLCLCKSGHQRTDASW